MTDFISAGQAVTLLSAKLGRPVRPDYVRKLARRKKHPVRTQVMSNRLLYNRADVETCIIRIRSDVKHDIDL